MMTITMQLFDPFRAWQKQLILGLMGRRRLHLLAPLLLVLLLLLEVAAAGSAP